jgi:hypothetical protein
VKTTRTLQVGLEENAIPYHARDEDERKGFAQKDWQEAP